MLVRFPDVVVGSGRKRGPVSVFPLFTAAPIRHVEYRLACDAIDRGLVEILELGKSGTVGTLSARNHGADPVLFIEGEHLVGVKQNRVVNTSILLAGSTGAELPVSCVEQGRWDSRSSRAEVTRCGAAPARLRRVLKASVTCALRAAGGHRADQGLVWGEIADQQRDLHIASPTSALADIFSAHEGAIESFERSLPYVSGATGVAMGIGRCLVSIDLFDKPSTCSYFWGRLLSGVVIDALREPAPIGAVDSFQIHYVLDDLRRAKWQQVPAVAQGQEYRWSTPRGVDASVLAKDEQILHFSAAA